jgi:hypothetical protein
VSLVILFVFGAAGVFFIFSGYNGWAAVQPIAGGKTTVGTVVSVTDGESCGRYGCSPNWTPTIRFNAPNGKTYAFTGPQSSGEIDTGQVVKVSFDPHNPSTAHDVSASDGSGLVLLGVGVFLVIFGLGSFVLGLAVLHRRVGFVSAREGTGWVGHRAIHSNVGIVAAAAVVIALLVVGVLVL